MQPNDVYLVSGVRTAVGDFGGSLKGQRPGDLGAAVVREAVSRAGIAPDSVGHCAIGNVIHTEAQDMYISRVAALNGGLSHKAPAVTVNRLCGSGLQAIITAGQQIQLGLCDTAVGGGVESMSRAAYVAENARFGIRMNNSQLVDMMVAALSCPMELCHMGITAENIAEKWEITREDQDALAITSHRRAQNAIENGYFKGQIVPIELKSRKGTTVFEQDEHVRFNASLDDMAKLRPVFKREGGTVTAGNASGINDGAAAVVLMSEEAMEAQGAKPRAKLLKYAYAGVEPKYMGIGPVPAVQNLLDGTDYAVHDIDVWEVNEAFAAQAIAVARDLGLPDDRLNPNGSGIALGHPIGATGAIITVKAIAELERTGGRLAVVTMCIGGGQGIAALFERV